eukprot:6241535-Alexandrium_andersonii.AAC.1
MAVGRSGDGDWVSAPPAHRCDVEVRGPLALTFERPPKRQLLVAPSAPSPLAQAPQAELAP